MRKMQLFGQEQTEILILARTIHEAWVFRQSQRGYHSPEQCPCATESGNRSTGFCCRCDSSLYPFESLTEASQGQYLDILNWVADMIETYPLK